MAVDEQHPREAIKDLLDGRIDAQTRGDVESHLSRCEQCREELEGLRAVKRVVAEHFEAQQAPESLRASVLAALDKEDAAAQARGGTRYRPLRLALAFGLPLLLVAIAAWLYALRPADLPSLVAHDDGDFKARVVELGSRTDDGAELESFFRRQGIEFETRVFDLGMMGYRLVGGRVHELAGDPSAAFVYRGPDGQYLLCQMFRGRPEQLPEADEVREHNGIRFHIYRKDGVTLAFWKEGSVLCVLASDIDSEELIQLAFAKAMNPETADPEAAEGQKYREKRRATKLSALKAFSGSAGSTLANQRASSSSL